MNRAALAHCPLPGDPVCALKRAQNPACRPPGPPLSHGRVGVRLWACGVHACEFTVFGERVSRPAVPVRVPHNGGAPAAGFMHAIRGHRPASRAGVAGGRTWLPAEASRELRLDCAVAPRSGCMSALSSGSKGMTDNESLLNGARGRAQQGSLGPRGDK